MKLWKVLGLAGLAGVTATGVIIARDRRNRVQLEPEDIRARLHERFAQLGPGPDEGGGRQVAHGAASHAGWKAHLDRWRRRLSSLAAPGPRSSGRHASR